MEALEAQPIIGDLQYHSSARQTTTLMFGSANTCDEELSPMEVTSALQEEAGPMQSPHPLGSHF